eukprot:COSAG06_NODE_43303_length_373_cov_0.817518_1_plen_64_part_01
MFGIMGALSVGLLTREGSSRQSGCPSCSSSAPARNRLNRSADEDAQFFEPSNVIIPREGGWHKL